MDSEWYETPTYIPQRTGIVQQSLHWKAGVLFSNLNFLPPPEEKSQMTDSYNYFSDKVFSSLPWKLVEIHHNTERTKHFCLFIWLVAFFVGETEHWKI